MISIKNLSYSFADKIIYDDLNLNIESGTIHSLIGTTGSGKTLLLKLMSNLQSIQSGIIDLSEEKFSFVFQQNPFLPWLTIEKNLQITRRLSFLEAKDLSLQFQLSQYLKLYPRQLSGGTLQKFNILRAFSSDSRIIFLDEPFTFLDTIQREILYAFILKIWSIKKPTVILVTHDIDEALMLSHSISYLSLNRKCITDEFQIRPSSITPEDNFLKIRQDIEMQKIYSKLHALLSADNK